MGGERTIGDVHQTVVERLRDDGQRYTSGRRTIVEVLATSDRPVTIAEVLRQDSALAQSSAYRNLAVLEQAGVVHRVTGADEFARFELAEDIAGHHHHLICASCGSVADFTIGREVEEHLERAFKAVEASTGFRSDSHRLDLVGTCKTCT